MRMHFKDFLLGAISICLVTFTNCQSSHYQVKAEPLRSNDSTNHTMDHDVAAMVLTIRGISGIGSGASLTALMKQGLLEEDVLETGEGTFDIWNILDGDQGKIGYVMEHPLYQGQVGAIYITSEAVETDKEIHIGSTWTDLQKIYPGIQAHGSEIEGIVTAYTNGYNFQLEHRHWSYEIDQSKINPKTKIDLIWLSHTLEEDDASDAENSPDHYICFTNDADKQQRIWVGYSPDENAILVKHQGQDKILNLIFEKEEYLHDGAYPTIIRYYKEIQQDSITGNYKITHSGNWDYVEYRPAGGDQKNQLYD